MSRMWSATGTSRASPEASRKGQAGMVFGRRDPKGWAQIIREFVYPRGGWLRAARYVVHRLRRLPDPPHRIGRGIFAGVFLSFTPFFGLHFIFAGLLAWAIRGNVLAALLATFIGNPLTTPFIALGSVELGHWMLGAPGGVGLEEIFQAFGVASAELWHNAGSLFGPGRMEWGGLWDFAATIFLPYLIGGLVPGLLAGLACHYLSLPVIAAYKKRRARKTGARTDPTPANGP
jgi:uncharacterized protein